MTQTQYADNTRIGWIDLTRVLACALVVISHCCDSFIGAFDSDRSAFYTGAAIGALARVSVPLFVLITATLLLPLPEHTTMGAFYRKRIGRILPPLVFWSIALPVLFFINYRFICPDTTNPTIDAAGYTVDNLLKRIALMVVNFNFDTVPLWYLYMLVGLYMIMPVLNAWLVRADRKEVRLFLWLWFVTLFIPYVRLFAPDAGYEGNFGSMEILGAADWNAYGTFYYFSGFVGYAVLAYYLKRWPPRWSAAKARAVCISLFTAGYAITFCGFVALQNIHPGDYAYLEVIFYFCGINVAMMTFAVFLALSRLKIRRRRWLDTLASLTFGIYLCHFAFVYALYDVIMPLTVLPVFKIILMAAGAFVCAALLSRLLYSNRYTRYLIA